MYKVHSAFRKVRRVRDGKSNESAFKGSWTLAWIGLSDYSCGGGECHIGRIEILKHLNFLISQRWVGIEKNTGLAAITLLGFQQIPVCQHFRRRANLDAGFRQEFRLFQCLDMLK